MDGLQEDFLESPVRDQGRSVGVESRPGHVTVACLGVAGSFVLPWVLVTRTRLGRII